MLKFLKNIFLYIVLDKTLLGDRDLGEAAGEAAAGGADIIQYRDKLSPGRALFETSRKILEAVSDYDIPLVINDRLDVALAIGAAGVHLGRDDLPVSVARKLAGKGFIVGASARTVERARKAEKAGADYLGVGPFFPTSTKAGVHPIDHELFSEIIRSVDIPVIAIGGIGEENLNKPFSSGASGVAVASALFAYPTIEESVSVLRGKIDGLNTG